MSAFFSCSSRRRLAAVAFCVVVSPGLASSAQRPMTFDERLECQRAVEGVLWEHRIWPGGNPGPKPDLAEVLPDEVLRRKVDDVLRLSTALADRWQQPITATDLQAELDRIVAETAAPEMLHEMLLALGYDPRLAAECLARPLVADRFAREAFAADEAIHGPERNRAQAELELLESKELGRPLRGERTETEWVRYGKVRAKFEVMRKRSHVPRLYFSAAQWDGLVPSLDSVVAGVAEGAMAPLQETDDRWWTASVTEARDGFRRVERVVWPKTSFDEWWGGARDGFEPAAIDPYAGYTIGLFGKSAPKANDWSDTPIDANTPSARELHTAVWTGSEMLIFGGQSTAGTLWSGGRYTPSTNSWAAMMDAGASVGARADHTAVWTGTRMVVWGGWSNGELDTGGRYNPTYNSWGTTTTTNAPSARRYHAACWTGDSMVVWGGWSGSSYVDTGAEYFLANTWDTLPSNSPTATDPSPRADHTATCVTDSSRYVVIWGGQDAGGARADGRRLSMSFNPPRWFEMTTVGDPSARFDHTAVEMTFSANTSDHRVIIWGGTSNGTTGMITGGAYNAIRDNWEPVTSSGAPSSRFGHTAVWTRRTMIVWGGESSGGALRSGGVFNYYNQDWHATTQTGAPTARIAHVAAYRATGTNHGTMVVWGGDDGSPTDTGGRYTPPTDYLVYANNRTITTVSNATLSNENQVSVHSLNGFTGTVTLSLGGSAPVVVSFSENPLSPPWNSNDSTYVSYSVTTNGTGQFPFEIIGSWAAETRAFDMTLVVQDYDLDCSPAAVSAPPGGDAVTTCTVTSIADFDDDVDLSCTNFSCTFNPTPVAPPANGAVTSELTVHVGAGQAPGNYQVEVVAARDGTNRIFYLGLEVLDDDLIFADGFESGNTSAWSATTG